MQRLPILLGANPRALKLGATIPLAAGIWRVVFEGVTNTRIHLQHDAPPSEVSTAVEAFHGYRFELSQPARIKAFVSEAGSEKHIAVFLEQE